MTSDQDWGPAREIASRFFPRIGTLGKLGETPLWDGKAVSASTPSSLLHEVAHFQIAPEWRRFKPGYGLGMEPEGNAFPPQLVSDRRSEVEESMASALGILWEAHLGYKGWRDTAQSHSWGRVREWIRDVDHFLWITDGVAGTLLRLGLITPGGVPIPVTARRWRAPKELAETASS